MVAVLTTGTLNIRHIDISFNTTSKQTSNRPKCRLEEMLYFLRNPIAIDILYAKRQPNIWSCI